MLPYLGISAVAQIALAVHAYRTGRGSTWIWILLMLPVLGSLAYLAVVWSDRPVRGPGAGEAHKRLAALLAAGDHDAAIELGEATLEATPRDARVLYLLALAHFGRDEPALAKERLDELDAIGSRYRGRERTELRQHVYAQLYA